MLITTDRMFYRQHYRNSDYWQANPHEPRTAYRWHEDEISSHDNGVLREISRPEYNFNILGLTPLEGAAAA